MTSWHVLWEKALWWAHKNLVSILRLTLSRNYLIRKMKLSLLFLAAQATAKPGMCGNYGCVVNMDTTGCSGTCNQVKILKFKKKLTSYFFKIEKIWKLYKFILLIYYLYNTRMENALAQGFLAQENLLLMTSKTSKNTNLKPNELDHPKILIIVSGKLKSCRILDSQILLMIVRSLSEDRLSDFCYNQS